MYHTKISFSIGVRMMEISFGLNAMMEIYAAH